MTCPECAAALVVDNQLIEGEIVPCPDCNAELEVVSVQPLELILAPEIEEDWGE
jgi:alpha-aminoadipate carrier protein LysW